jgi:hypothetical protein
MMVKSARKLITVLTGGLIMRRATTPLAALTVLLAVTAAPNAAAAQEDGPKLTAREQKFAEQMSGVALVGSFTVDGRENGAKPERYEIDSAKKLRDDYWVITARIKYGENDVKVPVTVKVLWAGDTPMISLTDLTIPGLGTFTSRVLFHGDRYAGTWQHDKVGGHLFGRIEKQEKSATEGRSE